MTIKKLTVAAAIAVGIATCSFSSAMAACPCDCSPVVTGGACPCQTMSTPCSVCPVCGQDKSCCKCGSQASSCGCGCQTTSSDCGCGCAAPACECKQPACHTYPMTGCSKLGRKEAYAYPMFIFGNDNYVGQQSNAIYSTQNAFRLDCCDSLAACKAGLPIGAAASIGYGLGSGSGCGCNTGCAAPLYGSNCGCNSAPCGCLNGGVPVVGPCNRGCSTCGCGCGCDSDCGCDSGCGCNTGGAAPCDCLPIIDASCGCNPGCGITIQTPDSMKVIERSFTSCAAPCASPCASTACPSCATGAASSISMFSDVPSGYWAGCAIDKLTCTNVIAGYPDRTFKPTLPVSRAEFASLMVKGLNLNLDCPCLSRQKIFKDVACNHWANPVIAKAVQAGIMCGYPHNMFKPNLPVSRVEALTAMAHGINCNMDSCQADQILSQYCDGNKVPDWAKIPVAKALQAGLLKDSPKSNIIDPCNDASRAEIASMLYTTRIASGIDCPVTASKPDCGCDSCASACPTCPTACPATSDCGCTKTTNIAQTDTTVNIPVMKLTFMDQINAKSSNVGDRFVAKTLEEIVINGKCYPKCSKVNGRIVEVIRPHGCEKGGLKVAFTDIQGCDGCKCDLPKQILSAQVSCEKNPNFLARLIEAPFTLAGSLVGTTARTVGGVITNLGNATEAVSQGVGIAAGDILQGPCVWPAAGRSLIDAAVNTVMAPIDAVGTTIAGAAGLFQTTFDEVAYLVNPSGSRIAAINPKEKVTIAFGCH